MRELRKAKDSFDYESQFRVDGVSGDVSLEQDYNKTGDGILWGLCSGVYIKAIYSEEDVAHRNRMNAYKPIQQGEKVIIEGQIYTARILGNFSDCVIFDKYTEET